MITIKTLEEIRFDGLTLRVDDQAHEIEFLTESISIASSHINDLTNLLEQQNDRLTQLEARLSQTLDQGEKDRPS